MLRMLSRTSKPRSVVGWWDYDYYNYYDYYDDYDYYDYYDYYDDYDY